MKARTNNGESRTAQMTTLLRALSYCEKNRYYKSDDFVAPMIIPSFVKILMRMGILKNVVLKKFLSDSGVYEYVISRTKYIDDIFMNIDGKVQQVVFLGAGFDSRGVRFEKELKNIAVFEVDAAATQTAKVKRFKQKNIVIPGNLKFVKVDFEKEMPGAKLEEAGFDKVKKTLFILEGLTMYLEDRAIESTFNFIKKYSSPGSIIVFDYVYSSVLRGENIYGAGEIVDEVTKAGENWKFGIEKGHTNEFLTKYGLTLVDEADPSVLERKYFADKENKVIHKMNGAHSIITSIKRT